MSKCLPWVILGSFHVHILCTSAGANETSIEKAPSVPRLERVRTSNLAAPANALRAGTARGPVGAGGSCKLRHIQDKYGTSPFTTYVIAYDPSGECMNKYTRRVLIFFGGLATLLVLGGLALMFFFGRTSSPPLPNPNGYDDLVKAGQTVTGKLDDLANREPKELRALVTTNAEALRLVRLGLSRVCSVPTDAVIANFGAYTRDVMALKSVARLLNAEGRLAESEGRLGDAAQSYIDAIRLGSKSSHGGFIITRLVGIASEASGRMSLLNLAPKLSCDQIRPLLEQLEQIDEHAVTWTEVQRNEARFARAQIGNYPNPLRLAADFWNARHLRRASEARHNLAIASLRLLTVELALRCSRSTDGKAPADLKQLVPKYLHRIPTDPFTGSPLVYKQTATNWTLYSVGPDRVDDGGKPAGRFHFDEFSGLGGTKSDTTPKNTGDVFYDTPW